MSQPAAEPCAFRLRRIGTVHRRDNQLLIEIFTPYRPGLIQLAHFSHVWVLWWAHQVDSEQHRTHLQMTPPYAPDKLTGVFASRAEYRPNPIGMTACKIVAIDEDEGLIEVVNIDAIDGTPVLDLKGYFPVTDRVPQVRVPDWIPWGAEDMPEEGIGLWEEEPVTDRVPQVHVPDWTPWGAEDMPEEGRDHQKKEAETG